MKRAATAVAVALALVSLHPVTAVAAEGSGGACLDPSGLCGNVTVSGPGAGPTPGGGTAGSTSTRPRSPSPYRWQRTVTPNACGGEIPVFDANGQPLYNEKVGTLVWTGLIDTRTGEVIRASAQCIEGPQPAVDAAAVPMPPDPPNADEVADAVPLPRAPVGINPATKGLTGLGTWLWSTATGPASLTVAIRGYTVTATASPTTYTWRMGDGHSYSSPTPGNESHPAAVHSYERRGDYTVEQEVTWRGSFTFSGNGVPPVTDGLGDVMITTAVPYHVVEVRAVLDDR